MWASLLFLALVFLIVIKLQTGLTLKLEINEFPLPHPSVMQNGRNHFSAKLFPKAFYINKSLNTLHGNKAC